MTLPAADEIRGLHQPQNHIRLLQGMLRHAHHIIAQLVFRLMDPRRVQKHDLPLLQGQYGSGSGAGGLGLRGGDRYLLPYEPIHQRGLSHVGPADQGHEARLVWFLITHFFHGKFLLFQYRLYASGTPASGINSGRFAVRNSSPVPSATRLFPVPSLRFRHPSAP